MSRRFLEIDVISAAAVAAWFGFTVWATYSVFVNGHVHIYAENGLIENMQAYLLVIACAIYLATLAFEKRSDKLILAACALLCYGFVVRELDVETFDIPRALVLIGSGAGRNISLAVGLAVICLYAALTDLARHAKAAIRFVRSKPGVLLMTAGVFLIIGELMEKNKAIPQHVFVEEMAELFADVLILLSSIATNAYLSGLSIRSMRPAESQG